MKILIFIAIVLISLWLMAKYLEKTSLYFPNKDIFATPKNIDLAYEDIYFFSQDNKRLNGWFIPQNKVKLTILFCHGNAGNISHRLEKIEILHQLGVNIFIFDYRGYGKSEGLPNEQGLYKDVRAAYDYLIKEKKLEDKNIIVYGESLGGAVAIDLATQYNLLGLITEDTFSSIADMARIYYPLIPAFFISSHFDNNIKIAEIKIPKLTIHSIDDDIVPFRLGEKLFKEAALPKIFLALNGTHNTAFLDSKEKYQQGVKDFLVSLEKLN